MSTGLVVAIGYEYRQIAERFAKATERDLVATTSLLGVAQLLGSGQQHATLVGAKNYFRLPALHALLSSTPIPLGILTGNRASSLWSRIQRTTATEAPRVLRSICIDAIHGSALVADGGKQTTRVYMRWAYSLSHLLRNTWGAAVVCGHGSCNHMNLKHAVVCGLSQGESEWPRRRLGCWSTSVHRHCKRATARQRVLYLSDIRARVVVLMTCSGFSLNGELFPSDASLMTATESTAAAAVMTTVGVYSPQRWEAEHVTRALSQGSDLAAIVRQLNGYHYHRFGMRPYVVYGDPAIRARPHKDEPSDNWLTPPELSTERDDAPRRTKRGLGPELSNPKRPLQISTPSRDLDALQTNLEDQRTRIEDRFRIIRAWSSLLSSSRQGSSPSSVALLRKTELVHVQLYESVLDTADYLEHAQLAGYRSAEVLRDRLRIIESLTSACDGLVISFLLKEAFARPIHSGLLSGLRILERNSGGPSCDQCACEQRVEKWGAKGSQEYLRLDCPICDLRLVGPSERQPPALTLATDLRPGSLAWFTLERTPALHEAWVCIALRSKPTNRVIRGKVAIVRGTQARLPLRVPAKLEFDTHMIFWALCEGLVTWHGRSRCSTTPL